MDRWTDLFVRVSVNIPRDIYSYHMISVHLMGINHVIFCYHAWSLLGSRGMSRDMENHSVDLQVVIMLRSSPRLSVLHCVGFLYYIAKIGISVNTS